MTQAVFEQSSIVSALLAASKPFVVTNYTMTAETSGDLICSWFANEKLVDGYVGKEDVVVCVASSSPLVLFTNDEIPICSLCNFIYLLVWSLHWRNFLVLLSIFIAPHLLFFLKILILLEELPSCFVKFVCLVQNSTKLIHCPIQHHCIQLNLAYIAC